MASAASGAHDTDVFLSTQAQSRCDDFEAEQENLRMARRLREQFQHVSTKEKPDSGVRPGPCAKTDPGASADDAKRTRKRKKTDSEQLMRLSGRPEKARKMKRYDPKLRPLSAVFSGKQPSSDEVKLFSGKEWTKVSTVLTRHLKRTKTRDSSVEPMDEDMWWFGDDEPSELEVAELNLLYRDAALFPSQTINGTGEPQDDPPITLSQLIRPLYEAPPSPEVIVISDESEVECSEDEGDLILLDNQPICTSSQLGVESQTNLLPQVTVSRINIRTTLSSQINTLLSDVLSTQVLDEPAVSDDEINDSLDEDTVTRTLLIKRKAHTI